MFSTAPRLVSPPLPAHEHSLNEYDFGNSCVTLGRHQLDDWQALWSVTQILATACEGIEGRPQPSRSAPTNPALVAAGVLAFGTHRSGDHLGNSAEVCKTGGGAYYVITPHNPIAVDQHPLSKEEEDKLECAKIRHWEEGHRKRQYIVPFTPLISLSLTRHHRRRKQAKR